MTLSSHTIVLYLVVFDILVYNVFECILKEPEEVKKPVAAPSQPSEKTETPQKGIFHFHLFIA